jgi:predicted nucleic acid-binding protein
MLCDSNILIYAADPKDTVCLPYAENPNASISSVSRIEILGFPGFNSLTPEDALRLEEIVSSIIEMSVDENIILRAIELRRKKKMSLADAIIAATALVHALPLVTRNTDDFKHIDGLQLINPFTVRRDSEADKP